MIRFISNTQNDYSGYYHKDNLLPLLEQAEEIFFSVGFLKVSGWRMIKGSLTAFLNKGRKAHFFIGTGEGVTDPAVLREIHKLVKRREGCRLILCTPPVGIFHAKAYVFRTGNAVTIVTGSANLTQGGWLTNDELSVLIETSVQSEAYQQLMGYFEGLKAQYYRPHLEDYIQKYEQAVEDYRKAKEAKAAFVFIPPSQQGGALNLAVLRRYYEFYPGSKEYVVPQEREQKYKEAKENLLRLAGAAPLSDKEFADLFGPLVGHQGYRKLWHSGSIHRHTHATYNYPDGLRALVRYAERSIGLPAGAAFGKVIGYLKELKRQKKIKGIGGNIVTEILMTYDPYKFANLNENPLKALRMAGMSFPDPDRFTAGNYRDYIDLLEKVRGELGLATFLEIDSFFNYIYWE